MSKLVKIEIFAMFVLFFAAALSQFYAKFPGCVASESFSDLAVFFVVASILLLFGLIVTLCEGK